MNISKINRIDNGFSFRFKTNSLSFHKQIKTYVKILGIPHMSIHLASEEIESKLKYLCLTVRKKRIKICQYE